MQATSYLSRALGHSSSDFTYYGVLQTRCEFSVDVAQRCVGGDMDTFLFAPGEQLCVVEIRVYLWRIQPTPSESVGELTSTRLKLTLSLYFKSPLLWAQPHTLDDERHTCVLSLHPNGCPSNGPKMPVYAASLSRRKNAEFLRVQGFETTAVPCLISNDVGLGSLCRTYPYDI